MCSQTRMQCFEFRSSLVLILVLLNLCSLRSSHFGSSFCFRRRNKRERSCRIPAVTRNSSRFIWRGILKVRMAFDRVIHDIRLRFELIVGILSHEAKNNSWFKNFCFDPSNWWIFRSTVYQNLRFPGISLNCQDNNQKQSRGFHAQPINAIVIGTKIEFGQLQWFFGLALLI